MAQATSTDNELPLPYYCFEADDYKQKFEGRYWNTGDASIAIVAAVTKGIDWAAYIGADNSPAEKDTLKYVAARGNKLSEKDARYFFPAIKLPYRH